MRANWKSCAMLVVALPFVFHSRPLGWGPDGHKVVCAIAVKLLSADDAKVVQALARGYVHPDKTHSSSFPTGCTFPDDARANADAKVAGWMQFAKFKNWHFLNVPRTTTTLPEDCTNCVFEGIRHHVQQLGDMTLSKQRRGEALLFLGHWVGDIHQPLHVSFADDRGGNLVKVDGTYGSTDLHKVWDGRMLLRARGPQDWWTYAGELTGSITAANRTAWTASDMQAWAQESHDITTDPAIQYCQLASGACQSIPGTRHLKPGYQTLFENRMELRLKQAGVRLAALLTRALHP
jgi:nuclease S1